METGTTPQMPADAQMAGEPLGFMGRFWCLFTDPRRAFASVGRNHEWLILWLLVSAISIGAYWPIKDIVKQDQLARMEQQYANLAPEQKEEILNRVRDQFDNPVNLVWVPVSQIVLIAFVAAVLLFVGNILLGGKAGYLRMLNAYAWTMLIVIPGSIVTVPLVLSKGSMDVSLGLGVLTTAETGAFVKKVLSSFELFGLWQVWLSSLAVSVIADVPAKRALWSVLGVWFVWVLVQGGLATLGMSFGA